MNASFDVVELVSELVRIPSVNPMGRPLAGEQYFEHAMTDRLEGLFQQLELPYERQPIAARRENIVACLEGDPDAGVLALEAHQDTVPVDGMTIEPWSGELRDGRVFGRGACDIKGGMACMLTAVARLVVERPPAMPTIVMACSVNEEHGFDGATAIARSWTGGSFGLLLRTPDAVVVAEPTRLDVVVAHKGVVRWRCHALGTAAHSSTPDAGDNAIYRMSRVLSALEEYARTVTPSLRAHSLVGRPTLSVGLISGGISVNTVPDRCTIEIDRRVVPGEDATEARQAVIDWIADRVDRGDRVEHEPPYICSNGLHDAENGALAERLGSIARDVAGAGSRIGVPYGTDATAFAAAGIPSVVFGPGSIEQAHTRDEWIAVDQLHAATEILYRFGRTGLRAFATS